MDLSRLNRIDAIMEGAIERGEIPGGVVLVARGGAIVFERTYGNRATTPTTEPVTLDTIYDLASLTKPIAAATAMMVLTERGLLSPTDGVTRLIPEFKNSREEAAEIAAATRLSAMLRDGRIALAEGSLRFVAPETTDPARIRALREQNKLFTDAMSTGLLTLSDSALDSVVRLNVRDREAITVENLLTHTSGLDPFDNYYRRFPERGARAGIVADICQRRLRYPVGERFLYSDLNYIMLGEIAERVSGTDLNSLLQESVYGPLGMVDTGFNPPAEKLDRVAPTEWRVPAGEDGATTAGESPNRRMIRGEVHDGNAYVQDGISGHAGLFSTVRDLAIFSQMMLNGGEYGGVRVFSERAVAAMTSDQARLRGETTRRGYGWDITSNYSGPRGRLFKSGFGHTGWTGTSIWIVPEDKVFIIILTNRVHPDGKGNAGPLRSRVANVVAASILP